MSKCYLCSHDYFECTCPCGAITEEAFVEKMILDAGLKNLRPELQNRIRQKKNTVVFFKATE